jgi:hypothetical protein
MGKQSKAKAQALSLAFHDVQDEENRGICVRFMEKGFVGTECDPGKSICPQPIRKPLNRYK